MKKLLLNAIAISTLTFGMAVASDKIVSIDSIAVMQKSKEGQKLTEEIKQKISDYQEFAQAEQKGLADLEKTYKEKKDVWSEEARKEKEKELAEKRKDFATKMAQREDMLRTDIQTKQVKLRDKQLAVANKIFEKEKWNLMVDKQTPGVLCIAKSVDQTDKVLKAVDLDFEKENKALAEAPTKKVDAKKKG